MSGNTVVSSREGAYLVLNQTGANATLTGNSIFGYSSDRILRGPGSADGNTTLSSRPAVNTSPINFGAAPATTPVPAPTPTPAPAATTDAPAQASGSDTLVLRLSGDSWEGNPRFVARVDGNRLGDAQEVTASRASGQSQEFTFNGAFGNGPHAVTVSFLNDAYAGTAATDRNLYVDGITFNGAAVPNASAALHSAGDANFTVGGGSAGSAERRRTADTWLAPTSVVTLSGPSVRVPSPPTS